MDYENQPLIYNQQQQYQTPIYAQSLYTTTVDDCNSKHKDDHHLTGAIVILIVGLFFTPFWLLGLMYIRSHNRTARILGITSICLFIICMVIILTPLIIYLSRRH